VVKNWDLFAPGSLSILGVVVAVCMWIILGGLGPTRDRRDPEIRQLEELTFEGERLEALRRLQIERPGR